MAGGSNKFKTAMKAGNKTTSTDEITEALYKEQESKSKAKQEKDVKNASTDVDIPAPVVEEPAPVKEVEAPKDVAVVQQKKLGRPAKEPKQCVSVYIPKKDFGDVEIMTRLFEFKSPGDYIANLVQKDLIANAEKINKYRENVNALKDL